MLQRISLENFKGIPKAQIDVGQITVLMGPNGTGKSSFLQALMLLRQSLGNFSLVTKGDYLDLGEYKDLIHKRSGGRAARHMKIGIAGKSWLREPLGKIFVVKDFPYTYESEFSNGNLSGHKGTIILPKKKDLNMQFSGKKGSITPLPFNFRGVVFNFKPTRYIGKPGQLSRWSSSHPLEETESKPITDFIDSLLDIFRQALDSVHLIPAIRGFASPDYPLGDEPVTDFITTGGAVDHAQRLASTLLYRRELEEILSRWFKKITGISLRVTLQRHKRVRIETGVGAKSRFNVLHEGFGSNQLIFGLSQLASSPIHSIICWEEPEIHLHPKAQTELCNVLVDVAKNEPKQIIITTHSEHILFAFVSAVRNGILTRDELSINYFEEKGKEPRRVEQDECGDIYDWGKNFF